MAAESAGALLRRAREGSGLHVAALAVALKVPVRKLEALEADRYDELTDAVFARALASSVCRTLKVDARPILDRLPQTNAPRLVQDREGLKEPFRAPGDPAAPRWADQLTRPAVIVVFGLLLAALVLVLMPTSRRDDAAPAAAVPLGMTAPALPPVANEPSGMPPLVSREAALPPPAQATTNPAASPGVPAPAVTPVATSAPVAPSGPVTGLVVFRASAPSWIEVVDSRGNVPLRRELRAGESVGVSGPPPLSITIGSANATAIEVRGKPFVVAPAAVKDNVARFEVR